MPDFLVIGAPKAGTTALHAALARHPGLYMSPVKEPKFFLSDGPPPAKGGPGDALTYREHIWRRPEYEALFDPAPAGTLRGEATPLYLYDRAAMGRIRAALPDARLIVIVRDPVERAHSNWTHLWSAGLEPVGDFVRACGEEERRIAAGWASFWHYIGQGRYGEQLEYLFTLFPREQVLVLRYRLLVDEPAQTLDRICEFLGVEPGLLTEIPRHNVTAHPEPTLAHRTMSLAQRAGSAVATFVPGLTAAALTGPLERFMQRHNRERQPLDWQQRQELIPGFEQDIKLLETVLGEDFADWLRPRERSGGMVGGRPAGQGQARNGRPGAPLITHAALILLRESPISPSYDLPHLREIHKRIFGDIYEWAGHIRTVAMAKGAMFCRLQYIKSSAAIIFRELHDEDCLRGLRRDVFVGRLAYYLGEVNAYLGEVNAYLGEVNAYLGEVNALHPFREGNGRAQRAFFAQLARSTGFTLSHGFSAALVKPGIHLLLGRTRDPASV